MELSFLKEEQVVRAKIVRMVCALSVFVAGFCAFPQNVIRPSDMPDGFASGKGKSFGANGKKVVTVSDAAEFKKYVGKGGYVVYVDGMIDITGGFMPEDGDDSTGKLSPLIKSVSRGECSTWVEYREKLASGMTAESDYLGKHCDNEAGGWQKALGEEWAKLTIVRVASGTTIIGADGNSGLIGADLLLRDVSNIAIRNMILQDAIDPFPHHEQNDGFNAENDCISIVDGAKIWIDHCTFRDNIIVGVEQLPKVRLKDGSVEKYQIYDGLCDIKGSSSNITVSYCRIENHDKVMLWGSSDNEKFSGTRYISLHHNYFLNCKQRLPLVRLSSVHIYNNYFDRTADSMFKSDGAIQTRSGSKIISEGNLFGAGINYSVAGNGKNPGQLYERANVDNSVNKKWQGRYVAVDQPMFDIPYEYVLEDAASLAETIPARAGAGKLPVALPPPVKR